MKLFYRSAIVLITAIVSLCPTAASPKTTCYGILQDIYEQGLYPGLSAVALRHGEIVYAGSAGYANQEELIEPDASTVFRVYSLSKGVTSILATILADEGKLDLEAPISNYLSYIPEHMKAITAQELIDHQSGIRHYKGVTEWIELSQQHCLSPQDALSVFINDPLDREKTAYSSFGYVLLSAVLESAGDDSFQNLMRDKVFLPSGSTRIECDNPRDNMTENVSRYYERGANGFDIAPSVDNSCKFGGGALNASPQAIAKIYAAFYSGKLCSKEAVETYAPKKFASLSGEGLGGRSSLVIQPQEELIVVIVANARGGNLQPFAQQMAESILAAN